MSSLLAEPFPRLEEGEGEPIIMLHGIFGSPDNWLAQLRHLADRYRVVVLDLPLFTVPLEECSIDGLVRHVLAYLDWAGISKAIFVGNSLGGHLALDLALKAPERVRALVLTGSSGLFERGFDAKVPVRPGDDWIRDRIAAEVFYDDSKIEPGMIEQAIEILASRDMKLRVIRAAKSAKCSHMGEHLPEIGVPTLLIWGKQDKITPLEVADEFHQGIRGSELVLIDNCGHAPMLEKPEEFARHMAAFLDKLAQPVGA